jgi:hypothetical protein
VVIAVIVVEEYYIPGWLGLIASKFKEDFMIKQCIELESEPCEEGKDCHYGTCDVCLCKGCSKAQCRDEEEILKDFHDKIKDQEPMPPEYQKVVDKSFWDLV